MNKNRPTPAVRALRAFGRSAVVMALVLGILPGSAIAADRPEATASRRSTVSSPRFESTRVLAKFRPGVTPAQKRTFGQIQGYRVEDEVSQIGWTVLEPDAAGSALVLARLRLSGLVSEVEFDSTAKLAVAPDDPYYSGLWGMKNTGQLGGTVGADIDAETAWDVSTGSADIVVAVVDTGADFTHEDLADNAWHNPGETPGNGIDDDLNGYIDDYYGWDFANDDSTPWDDAEADKHGTHVAGTIGAVGDNAVGVAGVNWDVSIMSCKFISPTSASVADGAIAIVYATDNGADVINHSWSTDVFSGMLADAVDYARRYGVINVCAAANSGSDIAVYPEWPAALEATSVVTVAATDRDDDLASFSNYNEQLVDIAAPGAEITSTIPVYPSALFVDDSPFKVAYFGFPVESIEPVAARRSMIAGAMDALTGSTSDPILVVDDSFATLAGETAGRRSSAYTDALTAAGYTDVDVVNVEVSGRPSGATLAAHTVVWFTGRMGYVNYSRGSLDATDRGLLGAYLDGGGDLLLAGGDIGTDLDYMGDATTWYANYLHAVCVDYESWTPDVTGAAGTGLEGLSGTIGFDDFDNADWPSGSDDLLAADGAATSLVDWSGYGAIGGTSMASPHVTGAIALAMAAFPGSTAQDAWTRIRNSVDTLGSLNGYVARSGRMNIGAALGDYPAPPTITAPLKGDTLGRRTTRTLTLTPSGDEAAGTSYEVQVGTPTDLISNGGFEQGSLTGWTSGGDVPWTVTQTPGDVLTGSWGARSGAIADDETSSLTRSVTVPTGGAWLTFDYWLDSEDGYDYAEVYVGSQRRWLVARDTDWSPARLWLTSGTKTITWYYGKDGDVSEGRDAFGLDNVYVSTYAWSAAIPVPAGSTEATFTVPDKTSSNGAVRVRASFGGKQSEWVSSAGLLYQEDVTGPSAPSSLSALAHVEGTATLTWTDPADADFDYTRVVRTYDDPPTGPTDGTIVYEGTAQAASDSGLPDGALVQYAAYARDISGNWSEADTTSMTATNDPPDPVVGLSATRVGDDVSLSWTNPSAPDFAGVRVLARDGTPPVSPGDPSADVVYEGVGSAALDPGVFAPDLDTTRFYAAYAFDEAPGFSDSTTTSITVDTRAPQAPSSLAAAADGDGGVALTWVDPTDADFDYTRVVRKIGAVPSGPTDGTTVYQGVGEAASDSGLTDGSLVYYAAYARDATGNWSTPATTSITAVDRAPDPVTDLAAARNGDDVTLTWTNPSSPDLVGVVVMARNGTPPTSAIDPLADEVYDGTATSTVDVGVFAPDMQTTRYYRAYSYDAGPEYAEPATASILVDTRPPGAPTSLAAAADGDGGVSLGWIDPADADFDFTRIVRTFDDPSTGPGDGTIVYEGTGEAAFDSGLADGALVHYAAYARDGAGLWSVPDTTSVVAADSAPDPVTNLAAVRSNNDVALSWTNPTSPDFVGVVVRARNGTPPTSAVDPLSTEVYRGTATSTVDVGVFADDMQTTRYYRAYAYDAGPAYAAAATTSILVDTRPPAAPTALSVTVDANRTATLLWVNPPDVDFDFTRIVRTYNVPSTGPDDGVIVYEGAGQTVNDIGLPEDALVHYAAYARDAVGHWSVPAATSIRVDTIKPSGTFAIAGGAVYTGSRTVALDSLVSGATQMRVDLGTGYGSWVAFAAKVSRTLPISDGVATVRIQYRDGSLNQITLTDDIIVDVGAPHEVRLAGSNRYSTAIDISQDSFAAGSASTVVLATGEDYADALGASALAGAYGGPVLLTRSDSLPDGLLGPGGELARLGAKTVVIVGGTAAVSDAVETQLDRAGFGTPRIFGKDRYATAAAVAEQTLKVRGSSPLPRTVFIARGDEYADALSVAPIAYATRAPVLLVKPDGVPSSTIKAIYAGGFTGAVVIGGTSAIPASAAGALGVPYERIAGADRYATAAGVATWANAEKLAEFSYVGVATGTGFADALGGGAAVGAQGGVVLLTKPASVPGPTRAAVQARADEIRTMWILGGPAAVSDATKSALTGLLPN